MMLLNGDLPANPTIYADMGHNGQREIYCDQVGLTKREMFAMAIAQGICASGQTISNAAIVKESVNIADELLAELERKK